MARSSRAARGRGVLAVAAAAAVAGALVCAAPPAFAASVACGGEGLVCQHTDEGTACGTGPDGAPRCICNTHWALGPTYTGAECEVPTVDCGTGVWCLDNGATCSTRGTAWAHGNGETECNNGGGVCKEDKTHPARTGMYFCHGGTYDTRACNAAISCSCPEGFTGAHCEHEIVICEKTKYDTIKHYCMADSSLGCRGKSECDCVDGYTGRHCEKATALFLPDEGADGGGGDSTAAVVIGVIAAIVAAVAVAFATFMVKREKEGAPLFKPLLDDVQDDHVELELGNGGDLPRASQAKPQAADALPPVANRPHDSSMLDDSADLGA